MLDKLTQRLDFHGNALVLRAERQRALASNIANADTPGYVARDFKFADALREATGQQPLMPESASALKPEALTAPRSTASGLGLSGVTREARNGQYGSSRHLSLSATHPDAITPPEDGLPRPKYSLQTQPALDNNSVDLDRERAAFTDNSVRYEATLRFINGNVRTMLSAIQGQ
ncbi:flagellar basal body rod protein FlgB [Acidovorax lacteus]|uniref:Flagellar basal body rod protein FlgB n=1 Tax=Acidovorax lacteus TaxID=1924988 RepID=A0ABP8KVE9_9BURK